MVSRASLISISALLRNSEILEIQSISRNQAGTYRCRATNTIEPAAVVEIKVDVLCKFW